MFAIALGCFAEGLKTDPLTFTRMVQLSQTSYIIQALVSIPNFSVTSFSSVTILSLPAAMLFLLHVVAAWSSILKALGSNNLLPFIFNLIFVGNE